MNDHTANPGAIEVELPDNRTPEQKWADAGQIMSVFCSDPRYRELPGHVLYVKLMPALALGQYAILRKPMTIHGTEEVLPGPVGAILWARVNDELHQRFQNASELPRLDMSQWQSGDHFWIIDAPGDPKLVGQALERLHRERFGGNPFNAFIYKGAKGLTVRTLGAR
ncbi:MAG: toxin-activating lysine-acyltransferase [Rhodobacter sp.]|nr:toxin-activating lysine-acyltransferase [Rhodobacter sp.]